MKKLLPLLFFYLVIFQGFAQIPKPDYTNIDNSKPTSFYSELDNILEGTFAVPADVLGMRFRLAKAPNIKHRFTAEMPLLYNNFADKFGIGDIRVRYFWLPRSEFSKTLGAVMPTMEVVFPTGQFQKGLGTSRWQVSPGLTMGFEASKVISFFPEIAYVYSSAPRSDMVTESRQRPLHSVVFKLTTPIVLGDDFFMRINPIIRFSDLAEDSDTDYVQEVFLAYMVAQGLQVFGQFQGDFSNEIFGLQLGLTVFLYRVDD